MSPALGQVSFDRDPRPLFLQTGQQQPAGEYSEQTTREIDDEVRRIIDEQYVRVKSILTERLGILRQAAAVLLQQETITGEELRDIVAASDLADLEAKLDESVVR
jgi:cell division protease FtsH